MKPFEYNLVVLYHVGDLMHIGEWFWQNHDCQYQVHRCCSGETILIRNMGGQWVSVTAPDKCLDHAGDQNWLARRWKMAEWSNRKIREAQERCVMWLAEMSDDLSCADSAGRW